MRNSCLKREREGGIFVFHNDDADDNDNDDDNSVVERIGDENHLLVKTMVTSIIPAQLYREN